MRKIMNSIMDLLSLRDISDLTGNGSYMDIQIQQPRVRLEIPVWEPLIYKQ